MLILFLNITLSGETFLKHGRFGAPHDRHVNFDLNQKVLSYTSDNFPLSEITHILPGKVSLSLSIV